MGGNELGDIILRCCCQFVNRIDVHILPVYTPTLEEIQSEPLGLLYSKHMQKRMAQELNCNISNATKKVYDEALKDFHQLRRIDEVEHPLHRQSNKGTKGSKSSKGSKGNQEGHRTNGSSRTPSTSPVLNTQDEKDKKKMNMVPFMEEWDMDDEDGGGGEDKMKEECVEGEVWWPWEAYGRVVTKLKDLRRIRSQSESENENTKED